MRIKHALITAATVTIAALTLAGCTTPPNNTHTPTSEPTQKVLSPVTALETFSAIAEHSCDTAHAKGTVQIADSDLTLVMLPESDAIDGYQAAYTSPDGSPELIYETDAFYACSLANTIGLAKESGTTLEALTSGDDAILITPIDESNWSVETSAGSMDGKPVRVTEAYTIVDGLITKVIYLDPSGSETHSVISYGVTPADKKIVEDAVLTLTATDN